MAKTLFNTFQEASAFSKNLAMVIKATTSVHREGDCWCVEDPRGEQPEISQMKSLGEPNESDRPRFNKDGFDKNGFDKDGFNRYGFDSRDNHRSGIGNSDTNISTTAYKYFK